MIVARKRAAYVDPFDRVCPGLGNNPATTDPKEAPQSVADTRKPRKRIRPDSPYKRR